MSLFAKKSKHFVGIYSILDPALSKDLPRFSPPFVSVNDSVALQALLETLRRHSSSFDNLYKSEFRRMELWRLGSVDLTNGKIVSDRIHHYKVENVGDYLDRDFVKHYMSSVPYGSDDESEVK